MGIIVCKSPLRFRICAHEPVLFAFLAYKFNLNYTSGGFDINDVYRLSGSYGNCLTVRVDKIWICD